MMKYGIFLLTTMVLYGCPAYDPPQGKLVIENSRDSSIYVYCTCSDSINLDYPLRPYMLDQSERTDASGRRMPMDTVNLHYKIEGHSRDSIDGFGRPSKKRVLCSDKTIRLFFITESTMFHKTWAEICDGQIYQQKMKFTEQELDSLNWQVRF